jgi:hypothetical protein
MGEITPQTSLLDIAGKVVFIMDNTVSPQYSKLTYCNSSFPQEQVNTNKMPKCYELMTYINVMSNDKVNMKTYYYSNLVEMSNNILQIEQDNNNGYDVNTTIISQSLPIDKKGNILNANTDFRGITRNYSINVIPMMYWINDNELLIYESLYNKRGAAIIPLSYVYKYIKDNPV